MTLRMRVLPRFPAAISATNGLKVTRPTGTPNLIVEPDFGSLVQIPNVGDGETVFFMALDSALGLYRKISFADLFSGVADLGFMEQSVYDPQGKNADAFARANQTGTQAISTVSGLQAALDAKANDAATTAALTTKAPKSTYAAKSAGYTAVAADAGATIRVTAAATIALTAAATLGNGWWAAIVADGGAVVIDPNGAETINGLATLTVPDGSTAEIICDGSNFFTIIRPTAWVTIGSPITLSGQTTVDWTDLGSYRHLKLTLECSVSSASNVALRVSTNNGSSFLSAGTDYSNGSLSAASSSVVATAVSFSSAWQLTAGNVDVSTFTNFTSDITNFNKALAATFKTDGSYVISGVLRRELNWGTTAGTAARNALRLLTGTTFATGQVTLEGIRG